ncbi:MAG: Gfo/Idh/MocA family protein [Planctomycetota bacterium]|jgi:predicted dehydrogenase
MENKLTGGITRREFLKRSTAAVASAVPMFVSGSAVAANAPSKRITMGCIGVGRMGLGDMRTIMAFDQAQVIAVCDVDANRAANAKQIVEEHYSARSRSGSYKGCDTYGDFRNLLTRNDIDAVLICTPDHWHALPAIAAAKAGKDIFIEKPLALTIPEGRTLSDTVRRYGRVLQVGSQQRSDPRFRFACELVRNGRIGRLHSVKVGLPIDPGTVPQPPMPVPDNLDYDMWLGPTPWADYTEQRVHPREGYGRPGWLRISDYCCGMITGWGAHHMDIAHWGIGAEYTGPLKVQGRAEYPQDGLWDVHGQFRIEYTYAGGVKVICADNKTNKQGVLFEGTEGWVYVKRRIIDAHPKSLLTSVIGPDDIHLYQSKNHKANFLECIRTRAETVAPVEIGHRSCTACVLGYIAMLLGRRLKWDHQKEQFINDDQANRMLTRPMRTPWRL